MFLWMLFFICGFLAVRELFLLLSREPWGSSTVELRAARSAVDMFHEFQESLEAGLAPTGERWDVLAKLSSPWGALAAGSLLELRKHGGALLPTLRRLRGLAEAHCVALREGRARTSQALVQACACTFLVPLFGGVLYVFLPGVSDFPWTWCLACLVSLFWSSGGTVWLLKMAREARWGGLDSRMRLWPLEAQCAAERFVALVRAGRPADLAWQESCEYLSRKVPDLAGEWGISFWGENRSTSGKRFSGLAAIVAEAGLSLRKAVQVSVMEGRPCTERAEAVLGALSSDIRITVDRELGLLQTRALKPLFIFVAPPLFGLLAFGGLIVWRASL